METQVFVAREREMARLAGYLERALGGQGMVCFVSGEAGSGKTALVTEFACRAQQQYADLVVAVGQSDAHTGAGDAYLPFREVLGLLTGDVEAKLAQGTITQENAGRLRKLLGLTGQALVEVGPDLIGVFVPGVGLATQLAAFVAGKAGWFDRLEQLTKRPRQGQLPSSEGIDQSNIFEQYSNVLTKLAQQQPLLLLLDDLQWADAGSIGLLFRLGRRIGGSRILLVGTYRPDEVALGRDGARHPLDKVLAEFKRYHGDICVELDEADQAERQRFVEAFLGTEPHRLDHEFRQALYHHTGGHPLFTVELLRHMQERGDLVRDKAGRWIPGPSLDWSTLPPRVDGVIKERIGRLEEELRETLTVASVEGEEFTAEVVARLQEIEARGLIRRLGRELERQHRLVSAQGTRRLGREGRRLSLYRFRHQLLQQYLYNRLDEAERAYLHEDVGNMLEELYGEAAHEIAVQLAWHYVEADIVEKAVHYLQQAGEQAAARFANDEAAAFFSRALDLLPGSEAARRYSLLVAREQVYHLQGNREGQIRDLEALGELAGAMDDGGQAAARRRAEVAVRRARYAQATADYGEAVGAAQATITHALAAAAGDLEAEGHLRWGKALWNQSNYEAGRNQVRRALDLARTSGLRRLEADALDNLGQICWRQGDYDGARAHEDAALPIYREIGQRRGEGMTLSHLGILAWEVGDLEGATDYLEQSLRIYREMGYRLGEGRALGNLGGVCHHQGRYDEARNYLEQALPIAREASDRQAEADILGNLAAFAVDLGDLERARESQEQVLDLYRALGDRGGEGIMHANLSMLLHYLGAEDVATEHNQQALRIARDLGDPFTEAYALTFRGHALAHGGQLAGAEAAYRQALDLWRESGQHNLAMEAQAGLAAVLLAQADTDQALVQVEEILAHLQTGSLDGTAEPFRVYLSCYHVLRAGEDPRARELLADAHRQLQERAARIADEATRRSFLENIPSHRELVGLWHSQQREG